MSQRDPKKAIATSMRGQKKPVLEPVPALPTLLAHDRRSPAIVDAYDTVRFSNDNWADLDTEFGWFAREYPRVFRHHFGAIEHRLLTIHRAYVSVHRSVSQELASEEEPENLIELSLFDPRTELLYWEFEALLNATSSALDVLARLMGPSYQQQTPASFSRFCRFAPLGDPADLFRVAQRRWVRRLKDYRDCFAHYTPIDTVSTIRVVQRRSGTWVMYAKLPLNPNARESAFFRFSSRSDVLKYAFGLHRDLGRLERASARWIVSAFRRGVFPARTHAIIGVGRRGA